MKKVAIPMFLTLMSSAVSANVLITEYVEGGSHNKAVEVSNLGTESVNLAEQGYKLERYQNGASAPTSDLELVGLLPAKASLVVYHGSAADELKLDAPRGVLSGVVDFNGDDAVVLRNSTGVVDVIGQVGDDPGSYWSNGTDSTKDRTWRRLISSATSQTDETQLFDMSQWQVFPKDTFDGIGCVGNGYVDGVAASATGVEACDGSEPVAQSAGGEVEEEEATPEICTNCAELSAIENQTAYDQATYYANANAADEADLVAFKAAIQQDISAEHVQLSYSQVWTAMTHTDEDPENTDNVILLYSGRSIAKASNGSGSAANDPDNWNREHVWPKSKGFNSSSLKGYTDIHHLRPTDISMNSSRGNNDFDNGGEAVTEAPENLKNGSTSWEPRDEVKGDVARMMFYMDTRYAGGDSMPDLVLVDEVGAGSTDSSAETANAGKLCTLLEWHQTDIVSEAEINRNQVIYTYQGNRNPFIDNPEWAETLYSAACEEEAEVEETPVTETPVVETPVVEEADDDSSGGSVNLLALLSGLLLLTLRRRKLKV